MKKVLVLLFAVVMSLVLLGCNNSEYQVDGTFTAYSVSVHSNAPQVTYVSVTIEDGKIVGYDIDVRQGSVDETGDSPVYSWNESTKKELGDEYGMTSYGPKYELVDGAWVVTEGENSEYEWYEQAEMIEDFWLNNGVEATETIDGRFSNIAGVTISDSSYSSLALKALELAVAGRFQAILCSADDLYIASMNYSSKGEVTNLMLDVLQGKPTAEGFAWSDKTKQELGDDYGMKLYGDRYEFTEGTWAVVDGETSLYEWYEQANMITDYVEANGWDGTLAPIGGRSGSLDGTTVIDDLAGVTVRTQTLYDVLALLFDKTA
jgi:major membrane immunogen (membrane-anchored lipoprotein)